MIGPLGRYWYLRLAGKTHWAMPAMWLSVAVDPAATSTLERGQLDAGAARRRAGGCRRKASRPETQGTEWLDAWRWPKRRVAEQVPPELGRLRWMAVHV